MKIKLSAVLTCTTLILAACGGVSNVLPEKDLSTYPVKKVMELGAQNYSYYAYDNAEYYYSEVIKIFTNDTPENMDQRAWATYEIGFIKFVESKYAQADKLFDEVLAMKVGAQAPLILAKQMKQKIKEKTSVAP
ncbi:MAG: hypothetical protein ABSG94_03175 [Brevinematales bacterium]|jgi:hypothetical protein